MGINHAANHSEAPKESEALQKQVSVLKDLIRNHPRLFVLTGAGCSTQSGIPDYRDAQGQWKRKAPVMYEDFIHKEQGRKRYWSRSLVGWRYFGGASPNHSHHALAKLEALGHVAHLVTQNVDGLHQKAGNQGVTELHGSLAQVLCLDCDKREHRDNIQQRLEGQNPDYARLTADIAPDGDADLEGVDLDSFQPPKCDHCSGQLKPDVVFFGESVPAHKVSAAMEALESSDALLAVGTSLTVLSGYRFCRAAQQQGKPIFIINLGQTRADDICSFKIDADCGDALNLLIPALSHSSEGAIHPE